MPNVPAIDFTEHPFSCSASTICRNTRKSSIINRLPTRPPNALPNRLLSNSSLYVQGFSRMCSTIVAQNCPQSASSLHTREQTPRGAVWRYRRRLGSLPGPWRADSERFGQSSSWVQQASRRKTALGRPRADRRGPDPKCPPRQVESCPRRGTFGGRLYLPRGAFRSEEH